MKKTLIYILFAVTLSPFFANAFNTNDPTASPFNQNSNYGSTNNTNPYSSGGISGTNVVTDAESLTKKLADLGNVAIYLLVALAIIFIVWNVVASLIYSSDPSKKTVALGNIGYGIAGLAIIVSIWGLVNILIGTFRTTPNNAPTERFPNADFINSSGQTFNANH